MNMRTIFPALQMSEEEKSSLVRLNGDIDALFGQGKVEEAETLKQGSIKKLTLLYGHWLCDFRCPNYCYTRGSGNNSLTVTQAIDAINQARTMGADVTYWPGNGEVTLLKDFWEIMQHQMQQGIPAVVFTNGSIFHNDEISERIFGISADQFVKRFDEDFPLLHLYIKYWSSDPEKAAAMVKPVHGKYPYGRLNRHMVPLALAKVYDAIDRERLGVEVMVSRENYDDVIRNILPAVEDLGIYGYVEPVILSGNASGRHDLLLTPEQHSSLSDIFTSGGNYCDKRQSVELIVKGNKLTPGIAIPPREEDKVVGVHGRFLDIFPVFHNSYFREMRQRSEKLGGCLCRNYWLSRGRL